MYFDVRPFPTNRWIRLDYGLVKQKKMSSSTSQRSLSVRSMDSDASSHIDGNSSAQYILGKDIRTAAINNDEETLSILLDGKDKLVREAINEGNSFGRTAVWFASSKNYDKILSLLIRYGADVNKADNAKETPAYIAARYNNAACLSILLKNGANMHLVEKRGEVPYILTIHTTNISLCITFHCRSQFMYPRSTIILNVLSYWLNMILLACKNLIKMEEHPCMLLATMATMKF